MKSPLLYTFGYEGLDIDRFVSRLVAIKIDRVADVRELPLSRKRGFSKKAFAEALNTAGIAYTHIPALGCPKTIRDRYRADNNWYIYTKAFNAHLASQSPAVSELAKASRAMTTCLVCFEADFNYCHRSFVARAVTKAGGPATAHITPTAVIADAPLLAAA